MFFRFPPDARWNPERSAVEFSIGVSEYEGVTRVPRRVFSAVALGKPNSCPPPNIWCGVAAFSKDQHPICS